MSRTAISNFELAPHDLPASDHPLASGRHEEHFDADRSLSGVHNTRWWNSITMNLVFCRVYWNNVVEELGRLL